MGDGLIDALRGAAAAAAGIGFPLTGEAEAMVRSGERTTGAIVTFETGDRAGTPILPAAAAADVLSFNCPAAEAAGASGVRPRRGTRAPALESGDGDTGVAPPPPATRSRWAGGGEAVGSAFCTAFVRRAGAATGNRDG